MRRRSSLVRLAAPFAAALLLAPLAPGQDQPDPLIGSWQGPLEVGPGSSVATMVHVEADGAGGLRGTVDSPEQKVWGLPLSAVERGEGGTVRIELAMTGGVFEGGLDGPDRLRGRWSQRGTVQDFVLDRIAPPVAVPPELAEGLAGIWEGELVLGAVELRAVLRLEVDAEGRLGGSFDSPDQGALGIALTRCDALGGGRVRLSIGAIAASFVAELDEEGRLAGDFLQGLARLPLVLDPVERATEVRRPQTPRPPFPYRAEEVSYENPEGGVRLAGTLTLPPGQGPFPAALLITGSGSQDRDEAIFEHRPFLVIADHLTRAGVAVLRVDDRGVGGSTAGKGGATSRDLAGDVAAGVAFLRGRPEVDPRRIGLIGHSEGGVIAPMVAAEDPELAFLVLLAGTGVPGRQILLEQTELLGMASGASPEAVAANRRVQEQLFDALLDPGLEREERRSRLEELLRGHPDFEVGDEEGIAAAIAQLDHPWMRFFLAHDPSAVLEEVACPVLALNGRLDLQVPWQANLEAIAAALEAGGNRDFEAADYPGLNHLFQEAETGLVSEYGQIEQTIAPVVLKKMEAWIRKRVGV